jgi:hypothetical protein
MPKRLLILIPLVLLILACKLQATPLTPTPISAPPTAIAPVVTENLTLPPPVSQEAAPFNIAWDDRSLFRDSLTATYQGILTDLFGVTTYHLAISLADSLTSLNGVEEVRYTNRSTGPLPQIEFAIFSEILGGTITVTNVTADGQPVTPVFQTGIMRLPLATPLGPGESVVIHDEFRVTIPTRGGDYYYGIFGYNDGILSLAHAYPTILVYNENGWNDKLPDLDGDPLFSETSLYLVSVDAPADLVLVAAGREVQRMETAGRQTVLYADGPARDFYLAAAKGLVKSSQAVGEVTINSYAAPGNEQYNSSALDAASHALQIFDNSYAPYPYTEFDIVPIQTSAGGVEFPGMTSVAANLYNSSNMQFFETVVVHELGHQWFYNLVGNETQDQPWLDESMAQFVTWQYYLDRYGTAAAQTYQREDLKGNWDVVQDATIPIGKPVSAYTTNEYVAIVYGRGAFFLQALDQQMGETTFDKFMHDYVKEYAWKVATTSGFELLAGQDCGCDVTRLFKEWVNP